MPRTFALALLLALAPACAASRSETPPAPVEKGPSVNPGINDSFLAPDLDVASFVERFETESREIYAERAAILAAVGLRPGMDVADIGAGTGLFTYAFAERVGSKGKVYAVDIAQGFVERIAAGAAERKLANIEGVLCAEDDARLPKSSIDLAFVCDTYHHFEYPAATLSTLRRALRRGGELIVIDFHRIEGVTSERMLGHVRAGEEVFTREIEAAGFELVGKETIPGLKENYFLRFRRR